MGEAMTPERQAEIERKHGPRTLEGKWLECGRTATCDGCYLLAALREAQKDVAYWKKRMGGEPFAECDTLQRRVEALEKALREIAHGACAKEGCACCQQDREWSEAALGGRA